MKNKGISLIVLIITIVVIIILAAAIILNLSNTNLIENANEAVVKQDIKTFQDELTMYIADKYVDMQGKFKAEDLDVTNEDEIAEIIPSIKGIKYEGYIIIKDGKLSILDEMPEPQKTWAMEALGIVETSNNTPIVAVNTKVESANATITGKKFAYNNPVIPVGFKAINTTDASWLDSDSDGIVDGWNNGLVIQDENLNEFVWVPVDGANVTYVKNFMYPNDYTATPENTLDDVESLPNGITNEITQITNYGGFYIGRYEAGVPANQTAIDGVSKETSDVDGIPVVKKDATVWTCISYDKAMPNAKKLYKNSTSVRSGIVTGTAWDTVCAWIQSESDSQKNPIHDVITDSTSWGNYKNDQIDGENGKHDTGYSESWKAKNIYDLAGNTWEWTGEGYSVKRVFRGGNHGNGGSYGPASYRNRNESSHCVDYISFRVMLFVM